MSTSAEPTLIDTNVLVYAHFQDSDHFAASQAYCDRIQQGQIAACVTPQILAEFFAVVTNPKRVTSAFSPAEALDALDRILLMPGLTLFPLPADIVSGWMTIVRQQPAAGKRIFDVQLVATMRAHGIRRIATFNAADFASFPDIEVVTP